MLISWISRRRRSGAQLVGGTITPDHSFPESLLGDHTLQIILADHPCNDQNAGKEL
jgi:hypothetical protein